MGSAGGALPGPAGEGEQLGNWDQKERGIIWSRAAWGLHPPSPSFPVQFISPSPSFPVPSSQSSSSLPVHPFEFILLSSFHPSQFIPSLPVHLSMPCADSCRKNCSGRGLAWV